MSGSGCAFADYLMPGIAGGAALIGLILLRIFGGKRLSCGEYLFGAWNFVAFAMHISLDTYFLYSPRILPKSPTETAPKPDDYFGCYTNAVRKAFRDYGEIDTRIFLEDFQNEVKLVTFGYAIAGSIFTLLTFFGHLRGAKWAHGMQIAAATWHIALFYFLTFPQYLVGFKQIKDVKMFFIYNLPFIVFPVLALFSSLCKLCCGNGPCGSVCPIPSAADKKKKQ